MFGELRIPRFYKRGSVQITSNGLSGIEMRGCSIYLFRGFTKICIKELDWPDEIELGKYIVEYIAEAISDMAAWELAIPILANTKEAWISSAAKIPIPRGNDMILDLQELIEEATEEFMADKKSEGTEDISSED